MVFLRTNSSEIKNVLLLTFSLYYIQIGYQKATLVFYFIQRMFYQRNLGILIPSVLRSCSNETLEHFVVYCLLFQNTICLLYLLVIVFRWFKFTLKPPNRITRDKLRLAIWDTSAWTFWLKFGHKGP